MENSTFPERIPPLVCTRLLSGWRGAAASVEEVVGFACSAAGFGTASEVGKRKPLVLLQCGVAEMFSAEEKKRVEQHDGGVGAQLLTLPQVRFSNARGGRAAWRREEKVEFKMLKTFMIAGKII